MSRIYLRFVLAAILAIVSGAAAALLVNRGDGALGSALFAGMAVLLAIGLYDLILIRGYGRRLRWITRFSDELRAVARGGGERLSPSPVPDLEPLRATFSEVADAIGRQTADLERQKETLREILDGMGEGVLAIDESKRIVLANDRICELFGVKRPEPGRLFYEVLRHSTLVDAFDHGLADEAFRARTTVSQAGQERQIEIRVVPVAGDSGIAAVALAIDVSQIERLARIRRDFIADFSHEVRTPLAGLRSSIETLEGGSLEREQEEQLYRILQRQLGRLERLVSDLSELNSIESGEIVLQREPTEIRRLLTDLAHDFFERAEMRKIAIIVEGEDSTALVDPIRIEQVFSNLIDNAIKHAPESDVVRIEIQDAAGMVEVRVSDRGPGIPRDEREKVFHRFYRMDKSRSGESAGTGLGLAITKHLVLQHGGLIAAEGELGEGTIFVVRLPKAEGAEPSN